MPDIAVMWVNFNGRMESTIGQIVGIVGTDWIVDFNRQGVEFRGLWPMAVADVA